MLKKFEKFVNEMTRYSGNPRQMTSISGLNESKREKIFLNGYEMWLDRDKMMIFDKEDTKNGIHFDIAGEGDGMSIFSQHITKDERRQLLDYIKYGK